METMTLKVTMNKIVVHRNGDSPGKSELYYTLMVDDQTIDALDQTRARKAGDGDVLILGNSGSVTKSAGASLTVFGTVGDDDGFLKGADDVGEFRKTFTRANNWGIGSHRDTVRSSTGSLVADVYYTIARA
jgi:hypothetical protein